MKKNGFTLIELLAVIIILGIIMLIAIPSVTRYINESRKDTYVDTARQIVKGAIPLVNSGELDMYDMDTTYYIPASCIPVENNVSSPFGDFENAYVIVGYTGEGYIYYWASVDKTHQGIEYKEYNKLNKNDVKPNIETIEPNIGIGNRENIRILDDEVCQDFGSPIEANKTINENGELEETGAIDNSLPSLIELVDQQSENELTPGDELTIGLDNFILVSINSQKTVLLAKYDINSNFEQITDGSRTNILYPTINNLLAYWDECQHNGSKCTKSGKYGLLSKYEANQVMYCQSEMDSNCAYICDEKCGAYSGINGFVNKMIQSTGLNITGRLLTYEEGIKLGPEKRKDLNGGNYWLGTPIGNNNVWRINNTGQFINNSGYYAGFTYKATVRPVIVINTSDLGPRWAKYTNPQYDEQESMYIVRQNQNTLTPGDEVVICGDRFFIVSSNENETKLFAKFSLNTDTNSQSPTKATKKAFSSLGYWDTCMYNPSTRKCTTWGSSLKPKYYNNGRSSYCSSIDEKNCAYVYDSNSGIYSFINNYVNKINSTCNLNATARLISLEELYELENYNIYGEYAGEPHNFTYWLGTASGDIKMFVRYSNVISPNGFLLDSYTVRPMLTIPTNSVQW